MRNSTILFGISTLLTAVVAMAYEEPVYEVLEAADDYEVRRYEPYLVAEVDVEGDFGDAGNKAFRILAAVHLRRERGEREDEHDVACGIETE